MELLLEKQELLNLGENLRGVRIDCRSGRCWLTQAGDSRDHILRPGGSFTVGSNSHLIVTATEACRLMLRAPQEADRQSYPGKSLFRRLKSCPANGF